MTATATGALAATSAVAAFALMPLICLLRDGCHRQREQQTKRNG